MLGTRVNEVETAKAFETLGLTTDATETQVKQAYRKLALVHHPDKNVFTSDGGHMKELNAAYEYISEHKFWAKVDPDSRPAPQPVLMLKRTTQDERIHFRNIFKYIHDRLTSYVGKTIPERPIHAPTAMTFYKHYQALFPSIERLQTQGVYDRPRVYAHVEDILFSIKYLQMMSKRTIALARLLKVQRDLPTMMATTGPFSLPELYMHDTDDDPFCAYAYLKRGWSAAEKFYAG